MIAVDTNVVVRFLTHDDPDQTAKAISLFQSQTIWLAKTVLLETYWVLNSLFGVQPPEINRAIERLLALPNVWAEDLTSVREALKLSVKGMDFADAMHLASRATAERFVSFDRKLCKKALAAGIAHCDAL